MEKSMINKENIEKIKSSRSTTIAARKYVDIDAKIITELKGWEEVAILTALKEAYAVGFEEAIGLKTE